MADKRIMLEVVVRPSGNTPHQRETQGVFWLFPGKAVIIGRARESADLPIPEDVSLSKRHFSIAFDGERCRLVDLGSKNGTLVNGNNISAIDLADEDVICAGQSVFRVAIVDTQSSRERTPLDEPTIMTAKPSEAGDSAVERLQSDEQADELEEANDLNDGAETHAKCFVTLTVSGTPSVSSEDLKASRMMAWIRAGQTIVVGRSPWDSDWTFRGDSQMSSRHFSVTCDGNTAHVRDLRSSNGTLINNRPLSYIELQDGDTLKAGQTEFSVQIMGDE